MKKLILILLALLVSTLAYASSAPLKFSQGDAVSLNFAVTTDGTTAMDLTGASFETKLVDAGNATHTYSNSQHTVTSAASGYYTLALTAVDTAALAAGLVRMAVRITQSGSPLTIHAPSAVLVESYP